MTKLYDPIGRCFGEVTIVVIVVEVIIVLGD